MSPTPEPFDLVVIGSGPAGEKGAAQAAYFGKRVAVVEREARPGGASVHTGTLPSKTLRETALYLTGFRRGELYGISLALDRRASLRRMAGRLRAVTGRQEEQILRNFGRHRIVLVKGRARFLGPKLVGVFDAAGAEVRRLAAEVVLIATGSSPVPPRGVGFADPDVVDSDRILDLDRIPDRLAVVGGGVIGCEYASLFAALGTRVTLIEGRDRLLGFLDAELSAALAVALERMGAEILLGDAVESIGRVAGKKRDALRVRLGSGRVVAADRVLFSAGRRGNIEGLDLARAGLSADDRGRISVDADFRTAVPGVCAAGDVIGFPALAATSMEQARIAVCRAFGFPFKTAPARLFPYGVYTIPEIAAVGSSEEELVRTGRAFEVGRARYENNARGQITGELDGFVKLVFDPAARTLLGAHLAGSGATELVHIPQVVMAHGGTIDEFVDMVFNFPTLAECFKYAAYDGLQRLSHRGVDAAPLAALPTGSTPACPAARAWFVGAAPSSSAGREWTVAAMDRWRRVQFRRWTFRPDGADLVPSDLRDAGFILAIGAPQGIPGGRRRLRACDRALGRGRSAGSRTAPGAALYAALRQSGLRLLGEAPDAEVDLVEACPEDLFRRRAGRRLPALGSAAGRRARWDVLRGDGLEMPAGREEASRGEIESAAAALAAYLWATGEAAVVGEAPSWDSRRRILREGRVVTAGRPGKA